MNLRHLTYFVAVAEERHFGRAAERLHMAQPPLSQAIQQLESEVGVMLLDRTTRRVDLTAAGTAYLDRARAILSEVEQAGQHARRVASGVVGHLTLGCVGSATYSLLPTLSQRLTTELPGVDLAFRGDMLGPDLIDALRSGTIDVALLRPPVSDPRLVVEVLRRERLMVALPADHPLASRTQVPASALAGVPLIVHSAERHSVMYSVVLGILRRAGVEPLIRHQVDETSTLITLVAGGLGVAVVPQPVTALALAGVSYRPLIRPAATVELAVAHRADVSEPHVDRAVEVIRSLF